MWIRAFYTIFLVFLFKHFNERFSYQKTESENEILIIGIIATAIYFIWVGLREKVHLGFDFYEILAIYPIFGLYLSKGSNLLVLSCGIVSSLTMYLVLRYVNFRVILFPSLKVKLSFYTLFFISVVYLLILFYFLGFNLDFNLLLLETVYERRFEVDKNYNSFILYTSSFISKFLFGILLLKALYDKKPFFIFIIILLYIFFFLTTSLKTVLFSPLMIIILYFIGKTKKFSVSNFIMLGIIFICSLEYGLIQTSLIGRRLLYIPSILNNYYFEFFENKPLLLGYGWYNPFVNYNLYLPPSQMISFTYWGDYVTSANNGLISSGFMNFGVIGVILYSFFLGIILKQFPTQIQMNYSGVFFLLVFAFTTSFFVTTLLSHGILLFLLTNRFLLTNE